MTVRRRDDKKNNEAADKIQAGVRDTLADPSLTVSTRTEALEALRNWTDDCLTTLRAGNHVIQIVSKLDDSIAAFDGGMRTMQKGATLLLEAGKLYKSALGRKDAWDAAWSQREMLVAWESFQCEDLLLRPHPG